jgi:acetyltransferase-like isoleucine patch superfamily enzyme
MRTTGKRSNWRSFIDAVSELTGAYRIVALRRHCVIGLSAQVKTPSRLWMGRSVSIQSGAIVHCGGKDWSDFQGYVRIGTGVAIGPNCVLYGAGGIELGDYVHLGPGAKLMSQSGRHDGNRLTANPTFQLAPIHVGAGSWIGAGAVILGGSRLGECVSVAPNSVVSGEVPSNAIVVGNPARVILINETLRP